MTVELRPAACSRDSAVPCDALMIPEGTVTCCATDTVSVTVSPFFTSELADGLVESTVPGLVLEIWLVVLTTRPSWVSLEVAWATGWPVTDGRLNEALPPR